MNVQITVHTKSGRCVISDVIEDITNNELDGFRSVCKNPSELDSLRLTSGGEDVYFHPDHIESITIGQR